MTDEHDQPRSEETDLVEITSRLGEPEAVHRTNQGSVVWRFVLGSCSCDGHLLLAEIP